MHSQTHRWTLSLLELVVATKNSLNIDETLTPTPGSDRVKLIPIFINKWIINWPKKIKLFSYLQSILNTFSLFSEKTIKLCDTNIYTCRTNYSTERLSLVYLRMKANPLSLFMIPCSPIICFWAKEIPNNSRWGEAICLQKPITKYLYYMPKEISIVNVIIEQWK